MSERLTGGTPDHWRTYENQTWPDGAVLSGASGSFVVIKNCDVSNPYGIGLDIRDGAHDCLIQGGRYHDCHTDADGRGGGIWLGIGQSDLDVRGVIDGVECDHCECAGINAEGNTEHGHYLSGLEVKNCHIHHIGPRPGEVSHTRTGVGIYLTTVRECDALNNIIHDCTMSCIHADCDTKHTPPLYPCKGLMWSGNEVWNAGMSLIEHEGSVGCIVTENTCKGGAGWDWKKQQWEHWANAILFSWHASNNTAEYNTITDEFGRYTGPLIEERDGAHDNVMEPHTINIPFEEVLEMVVLQKTVSVPTTFTKYLAVTVSGDGHIAQVEEQKANGDLLRVLWTYTISNTGELVGT